MIIASVRVLMRRLTDANHATMLPGLGKVPSLTAKIITSLDDGRGNEKEREYCGAQNECYAAFRVRKTGHELEKRLKNVNSDCCRLIDETLANFLIPVSLEGTLHNAVATRAYTVIVRRDSATRHTHAQQTVQLTFRKQSARRSYEHSSSIRDSSLLVVEGWGKTGVCLS